MVWGGRMGIDATTKIPPENRSRVGRNPWSLMLMWRQMVSRRWQEYGFGRYRSARGKMLNLFWLRHELAFGRKVPGRFQETSPMQFSVNHFRASLRDSRIAA